MSNKQTAIEWLESELDWLTNYMMKEHKEQLFNQAKAMEKENLRDAYEADTDLEFYSIIDKKFEKYYKKTYGK